MADLKRKAGEDAAQSTVKRKKQWRVPRKDDAGSHSKAIQPGDSGIWATCDKGREGKCIGELRDLFTEYAENMSAEAASNGGDGEALAEATADAESSGGIESEIQAEIDDMHEAKKTQLFTPLRVDVQCVVFMKTAPPINPVTLVKQICQDAMDDSAKGKRTRFVKRLSPMTEIGRASTEGLEKVATSVLAPHFHLQPAVPRKFAIRPTLRNHNILTRDSVIQQIAKIVGPGHTVDLKNYDLLIVVEVYQNICGVSVLDNSFERLKRYNLAEIYSPTPVAPKE